MKSKKKVPPAVIRYRKSHPVIGFVLTAELKTLLDERRGNLSYGKFVKKLLADYLNPYEDGYNKGYEEGYETGEEDGSNKGYEEGYETGEEEYKIWYNCCVCGDPIIIKPNSESHKRVIELMEEKRRGHAKCFEEGGIK